MATCFVISPIGSENSDIRKRADEVYDLIVEPALEKYGLQVIRADKHISDARITQEIINFIQQSELCIADLTGHNPNVMYECGRRHELLKPMIMIAEHGNTPPFDLFDEKTIFYDVGNTRKIRQVQQQIQARVDQYSREGFSERASTETIGSLAETLSRIERKINQLSSSRPPSITPTIADINLDSIDPIQAMFYAIQTKDLSLAESVIGKIGGASDEGKILMYARCAALGSHQAASLLKPYLNEIEQYDKDTQQTVISNYVRYCCNANSCEAALGQLANYFTMVGGNRPRNQDDILIQAFMLNQQAILFCSSGQIRDAIEVGRRVVSLSPTEPAYHFYLSIAYEKQGDLKEAEKCIREALALSEGKSEIDADHYSQAYDIFSALGEDDEAADALEKLRSANPILASIKEMVRPRR